MCKQEFYDWWVNNGKLGRDPAFKLFREQNYPIQGINSNDIRSFIREFKGKQEVSPKILVKEENKNDLKDTKKFLQLLKNGKPIDELKEIYGVSRFDIISVIAQLKRKGYNINCTNDMFKLETKVIPKETIINNNWDGEQVIRFGVVSDTHLCSKYQQLTYLNNFYDICYDRGIRTVYHAGDITDGFTKRRPEHIYELHKIGADEQSDYIIDYYPKREFITTKFIIGNHDAWHIANGGVDIGRIISNGRKDMEYLGSHNVTINLTDNCRMEINHPLDGSAYALSYSIQKYMDSMMGGEKPNILLNGHHHKAMYLFYRNIHALECGTFEAQTPWMKGKRLAANVGGFIVTIHVDKKGTIKRFIPEFIPYYKMIKGDY